MHAKHRNDKDDNLHRDDGGGTLKFHQKQINNLMRFHFHPLPHSHTLQSVRDERKHDDVNDDCMIILVRRKFVL